MNTKYFSYVKSFYSTFLLVGILSFCLFFFSNCTTPKSVILPVESAELKSNASTMTPPTKQGEISKNTAQIFLQAYASGNISLCDQLNFTTVHVQCIVATSVKSTGTFNCNSLWNSSISYSSRVQSDVVDVSSIDACYLELTLVNNVSHCQNISNEILKNTCLRVIA